MSKKHALLRKKGSFRVFPERGGKRHMFQNWNNVDPVDTADIVHTFDALAIVKNVNSVDNVSSVNSVHNVPVLEHVPLSASFRKDPEGPLYP